MKPPPEHDDVPEPPDRPTEAWWERELLQNQKLMDKYMAALGDDPDWDKWKNPEHLYNKVHFGIDPPEVVPGEEEESDETPEASPEDAEPDVSPDAADEAVTADDTAEFDFETFPPDNEGYPDVALRARDFAVRVFKLEQTPEIESVFYLSAGKIGANLAGGHGLGYDEETICGNIVKCRWALSDAEFCREMLEHMVKRNGKAEYDQLLSECHALCTFIRERIERLRARVWW